MLPSTPIGNEEIADWIELSLMCSESRILRFSEIERLSERNSIGDIEVSMAINVISRRSSLLGESYPFITDGRSIRIEGSAIESGYAFCLLNSLTSNLVTWDSNFNYSDGAELFEEFALSALNKWLGSTSRGVNFGWPSRYGRPVEFNHAIDWLAAKLGVTPGSGFRPPRRKDGGVDLVIWNPFPDNRAGFPIYLAQCTLQQDFASKGRDIDLRLWAGWLALERDPETILAIPRTVPVGLLWTELTANNLVFERIRLAKSFGADKIDPELVDFASKKLQKIIVGSNG